MRFSSLTLVLGFMLGASSAFPGGSRVGNGSDSKQSSTINMTFKKLNIKTEVPLGFNQKTDNQDEVTLTGPIKLSKKSIGHFGFPMKVNLQNAAIRYPELKTLSKDQWINWFEERNWKRIKLNSADCPRLQFIQNEDYGTVVVAWGMADGVAVTFDNMDAARNASKRIIESMQRLDEKKKCTWN